MTNAFQSSGTRREEFIVSNKKRVRPAFAVAAVHGRRVTEHKERGTKTLKKKKIKSNKKKEATWKLPAARHAKTRPPSFR